MSKLKNFVLDIFGNLKMNNELNDPYLCDENCYNRLRKEYLKYGSLVVAIDYDGCINDYHSEGFKFPQIIELLKDCNQVGFKLVVYSASPQERWPDIEKTFLEHDIKIEGINIDIIDWRGEKGKTMDYSKSKIFYNILLDDRAGLASAFNVLRRLVNEIIKDIETERFSHYIDQCNDLAAENNEN